MELSRVDNPVAVALSAFYLPGSRERGQPEMAPRADGHQGGRGTGGGGQSATTRRLSSRRHQWSAPGQRPVPLSPRRAGHLRTGIPRCPLRTIYHTAVTRPAPDGGGASESAPNGQIIPTGRCFLSRRADLPLIVGSAARRLRRHRLVAADAGGRTHRHRTRLWVLVHPGCAPGPARAAPHADGSQSRHNTVVWRPRRRTARPHH